MVSAPNAALARDLIVKFERIGRTGTTPEAALTIHIPAHLATDADRIAEVLYLHCKRHLLSRDFEITVDMESGEVFIEFGRFGKGRILVAEPLVGPRPGGEGGSSEVTS